MSASMTHRTQREIRKAFGQGALDTLNAQGELILSMDAAFRLEQARNQAAREILADQAHAIDRGKNFQARGWRARWRWLLRGK